MNLRSLLDYLYIIIYRFLAYQFWLKNWYPKDMVGVPVLKLVRQRPVGVQAPPPMLLNH